MKIVWYFLVCAALELEALRLKVGRYFLKRRIKKLLAKQNLILTNFERLAETERVRPRTVNIWPYNDDGIEHNTNGESCVCLPRVEIKTDDEGEEFKLITHREVSE